MTYSVYTLNIQNNCHQWLSDGFRVHQICFRQGLYPELAGGAYSALPGALLLRGRGGEEK